MPIEFRRSTPDDLPGIIALMRAAFDSPADAPYLNPELLRWKYFEAAASYVLAQNGRLIAHGCAWPVQKLDAICLIDWASAAEIPGMGILMVRKMGLLAPVMLSIGGSEATRKIMPRIGFASQGELLTYVRVLRPWKQFLTRPGGHGPKAMLRLVRNLGWSLAPTALTHGWTASPVEAPLRCPATRLTAYTLRGGSLLLSQVGGQARIARMCAPSDLAAAYAVAIELAHRDPDACELIALAHDGPTKAALEANGFQERFRRPVFVADPQKRLGPEAYPLALDMLDDDMFYMNTPEYPYLT